MLLLMLQPLLHESDLRELVCTQGLCYLLLHRPLIISVRLIHCDRWCIVFRVLKLFIYDMSANRGSPDTNVKIFLYNVSWLWFGFYLNIERISEKNAEFSVSFADINSCAANRFFDEGLLSSSFQPFFKFNLSWLLTGSCSYCSLVE